jgi:hypothetical protein
MILKKPSFPSMSQARVICLAIFCLYSLAFVTAAPVDANKLSEVGSAVASPTGSQELTRGSIFMLVTTLGLGSVYQPFSGSLIFGPCSRFWRLSPISAVLEIVALMLQLGAFVADKYGLPYLWDASSGVSSDFGIRDAASAIVIARALNAPPGARKRLMS